MLPAAASVVAAVPASGERWRVLGAFPTAVYLTGPRRAVLPVVTADALLLPNAWRLPLASTDLAWAVGVGTEVVVEADRSLRVGAHRIRPVRTWRPRAVRRVVRAGGGAAKPLLGAPALDGDWVAARVGLGPGLTPEGDDEVCGALLVAHALGDPGPAAAARSCLHRTTDLSAALLRCAGDGLAVPQLTAFVDALVDGDHDLADRVRPAVLAIGHSSGPALVRGAEAALATLDEGELLRA